MEPLYCGHLGDLVKCPVYSGALYCGHLGDLVKCSVYSGTPLLWTPWGPGEVSCIERCPHFRGKLGHSKVSLLAEVFLFQGCPLRGVPLYFSLSPELRYGARSLAFFFSNPFSVMSPGKRETSWSEAAITTDLWYGMKPLLLQVHGTEWGHC